MSSQEVKNGQAGMEEEGVGDVEIVEDKFFAHKENGVWHPGMLKDLSPSTLSQPCGAQCPWLFIFEGAKKILSVVATFKADDLYRNQRISVFEKSTDSSFTTETTRLACKTLSE